jgi:very-short-patch-repair endonuclease
MDFKIIDNEDFVTCRLCGELCKRIYGRHLNLKHDKMSTKEYKSLFPNAPLYSKTDSSNTTKNSGKHMKEDKYKKLFSEMFSGDKNPNHKSRSTELERKSRSPFSKEFINWENDEQRINFISKVNDIKPNPTKLKYWMDKGFSEEEAIVKRKDRQTTFSLKKCIEKYGQERGIDRWMERQEKWIKNNKKSNYSRISQELFISLYENLNILGFKDKIYFASLDDKGNIHNENKNFEYRLKLKKSYILPDFFIPSLKLIIEFDGTYYHRNTPENKKREIIRDNNIKDSGYDVIHIKEKDYLENKENIVDKISLYILQKKTSLNV